MLNQLLTPGQRCSPLRRSQRQGCVPAAPPHSPRQTKGKHRPAAPPQLGSAGTAARDRRAGLLQPVLRPRELGAGSRAWPRCGAVGHHPRHAGARLSPHLRQARAQASQERAGPRPARRAARPKRSCGRHGAGAPGPLTRPAPWLSPDSTDRHGESSKPVAFSPKSSGQRGGRGPWRQGGVPRPGCCREEQMPRR